MEKNQLKAGVILSYMAMAIQGITLLLYTPIVIRVLGKSEYGIYELAASIVSYLGLLSFGFASSYTRFYFRFKKDNDKDAIAKLNGMFLVVFLIVSIVSLVAGGGLINCVDLFFAKGLTGYEIATTKKLMAILIINIAITFPNSVFESYLIVKEQYIFQRGLGVIQALFNPFISLILLISGFRSIALVIVTTTLTVIKFAVNVWYCLKKMKMKLKFRQLQFKVFKEIGVFSFYIFLNIITDQINWAVDKTLLAAIVNSSAVAIYSAASQINQSYLALSTSVSSVFAPRINRLVMDEDDSVNDLFVKVGRVQFLILGLILCGFITVGRYFIYVWVGKGYEESYKVALLLIIPVTVPLIQNLGIEIQKARNLHKFRSVLYVLIALVNILISVPLIKKIGVVGAALGTSIGLIIGNILIMNWYYSKIGIDVKKFWNEIGKLVPAMLISVAIGFLLKWILILDSIVDFLMIGIVYVISYIFFEWKYGMNSFEKGVVKNLIKRR